MGETRESPANIPDMNFDLVRKYNVPGPRYTSYPTALQFSETIAPAALIDEAKRDFAGEKEISLYVHLPFCESLCRYCACNTIITTKHDEAAEYLNYLAKEISLWTKMFSRRQRVGQLHFGGGTPTFLRPAEIEKLGAMLHAAFDFAGDAEISVEIDPRRLTREHVAAYRKIGATRASLGVQDFDAKAQKSIHRIQSLDTTETAVRLLRDAGYASVNFDLIYGLPHQTEETFSRTLDAALSLSPDRLAVFSYAHVPWIKPAQKILEREGALPTPEQKLVLLKLIIERLTGAGYENIGMDHFAKPTDELAIARRNGKLHRNFQGYSTRAGLSLLGLGVSSISQTDKSFRQNERELPAYKARLDAGELPVAKGVFLSDDDRRRREIIMKIMCGSAPDSDLENEFPAEREKLRPLEADGLVKIENGRLTILPAGRLFVRNIAMVFDTYLQSAAGRHSKTV